MNQGGAGGAAQGGAGGGTGGAGGSMMLVEDCDNMADDDGDGMDDCADTDCAAAAVCGKLLINEVDYDQLGTDTAEFIELHNAGMSDIDMSTVHLVLVNGSNNTPYTEFALPGTLGAGAYMVITSGMVMNIDPAATVVAFPMPSMTGDVQNGAPDGIALFDAKESVLLDALSYEGSITSVVIGNQTFSLESGTPIVATDSPIPLLPTASLIRFPNAQDTGDDGADWTGTTLLTPGYANEKSAEVCDSTVDEDFDTLTDCADPDCIAAPNCVVAEICDNALDDDGDMLADCADMDCDMQMCGPFGNVCTGGMCVCPTGLMMEASCSDMMDDDCDGDVDCADADCVMAPNCVPVEICGNGIDDDGDMMTDCADADCDMQACNAFGSMCTGGMCVCPTGMMTEMTCNDMMDDDCDGNVDCIDADCSGNPVCPAGSITGVNYQVITHGGVLVITGMGFTGATTVTIGGVAQTFTVDSDTQITITLVGDATPLGAQNVVVTTPQGSTPPFGVTVIHLLINESDADTPGTDIAEFVEISTGVPNVSLAGYALVHYNGTGDVVLFSIDLNATTDANGLLLLGNAGVVPAPALTWMDNTLQNGPDAIALYQSAAGNFIAGMTTVTAVNLIDALVYDTNDADDAGLLDGLIAPVGNPARVQVDEAVNMASAVESIQRCGDGRRNGTKFTVGMGLLPTPGAPNNVPACP